MGLWWLVPEHAGGDPGELRWLYSVPVLKAEAVFVGGGKLLLTLVCPRAGWQCRGGSDI